MLKVKSYPLTIKPGPKGVKLSMGVTSKQIVWQSSNLFLNSGFIQSISTGQGISLSLQLWSNPPTITLTSVYRSSATLSSKQWIINKLINHSWIKGYRIRLQRGKRSTIYRLSKFTRSPLVCYNMSKLVLRYLITSQRKLSGRQMDPICQQIIIKSCCFQLLSRIR